MNDDKRGLAISAGAVLVIAVICSWFSAQYAVQHSDQSVAKSNLVAERKIQQAKDLAAHTREVAQYRQSIKACQRGNRLRGQLNSSVIRIEREFLKTARVARLAAVAAAPDDPTRVLNQRAADAYRLYIAQLKPLPLIHCYAVYTPPPRLAD